MQQEIPNIPQSEINKRISESWKRLSVAEKAHYLEKAKSEKEGTDTVSYTLKFLLRDISVHRALTHANVSYIKSSVLREI